MADIQTIFYVIAIIACIVNLVFVGTVWFAVYKLWKSYKKFSQQFPANVTAKLAAAVPAIGFAKMAYKQMQKFVMYMKK